MYKYCQVCGSPIFSAESHGTESDGQYSRDFCSNCYKGGQFSGQFTGDRHYDESPLAIAAPYHPGTYGYAGYNLL